MASSEVAARGSLLSRSKEPGTGSGELPSHDGTPAVPDRDAWVAALKGEMRSLLGDERSQRWFGALTVLEDDGNTITLGVPNLFVLEWIEQRYLPQLEAAASRLLGPRKMKLHVDGRLFRRFREDEAEFLRRQAAEAQSSPGPVANGRVPTAAEAAAGDVPVAGAQDAMPAEASTSGTHSGLNERHTLENFVVGACNHVAYSAGMEVLRKPGSAYNPLYIHGDSGLGKTHLLQGLTRRFFRQGERDIRYLTCEAYVGQFVRAVQERTLERFRRRFLSLGVLVLDDLAAICNKEKSQAELLHTIDGITAAGGQVILASDVAPARIPDLPAQLRSRLLSGLVCKLKPPDDRTRSAILEQELARWQLDLAEDVKRVIAESGRRNVRELIGALVKVAAVATLLKEPVTAARARALLEEQLDRDRRAVDLERIATVVGDYYRVGVDALCSRSRERSISSFRHIAIYLARTLTDHSLAEIGRFFGRRNHATVNSSFRKILAGVKSDRELKREVEDLNARLR